MMHRFVFGRLVRAQVLSINNISVGTAQLDVFSSLGFIQNGIGRLFSTGEELVKRKQPLECSFTVSYLINSCGLSPEIAKSVAKRVKIQSCKQPDLVLTFLRNGGFTDSQIAKLVRLRPRLLLAHLERSVLPKIEFLKSIGITDTELANLCSSTPAILGQSLENVLIPNYKFLKSVLLSDENVIKVFRKRTRIFNYDLQKTVSPNVAVLRKLGMPESHIVMILTCYSPVVLQRRDKFDENAKKVIELGFDPRRCEFVHAMQVFVSITQTTLERKLDFFRKWGWSDEDIRLAFRKCPMYVTASENKVASLLDFLVNKMGWQSSAIATYPLVFLMNLEKRTIPRCLVIKVLQLKGLVKKSLSLGQVLRPTEMAFYERFVAEHLDDIPQLVNIYQRKEGLEALGLNNYMSSSLSTSQNK